MKKSWIKIKFRITAKTGAEADEKRAVLQGYADQLDDNAVDLLYTIAVKDPTLFNDLSANLRDVNMMTAPTAMFKFLPRVMKALS